MRDHENAPLFERHSEVVPSDGFGRFSHSLQGECISHGHQIEQLPHERRKDLVLIDWEQSGASPSILAPEANGCWDVEKVRNSHAGFEESDPTKPVLLYKKYQGPPRENLWSWPKWDVFPIWRDECPKALELAEVFSLGRTMWMLLHQQVDDSEGEDLTMFKWHISASEVPQSWKAVVLRCVEVDPNKRIRLAELVSFWEQARLDP